MASNDPVIREILATDGAESLPSWQREPSMLGGEVIKSKESLQTALATSLQTSVDSLCLH